LDRKHFIQWLERIYATAETEVDCEQLQAILPAYVEFEIAGGDPLTHFPQALAHLGQCPDCAEEYEGLRKVAGLEARSRLPQAEESLAQFEDVPTPEPDELIPVSESDKIPTGAP